MKSLIALFLIVSSSGCSMFFYSSSSKGLSIDEKKAIESCVNILKEDESLLYDNQKSRLVEDFSDVRISWGDRADNISLFFGDFIDKEKK